MSKHLSQAQEFFEDLSAQLSYAERFETTYEAELMQGLDRTVEALALGGLSHAAFAGEPPRTMYENGTGFVVLHHDINLKRLRGPMDVRLRWAAERATGTATDVLVVDKRDEMMRYKGSLKAPTRAGIEPVRSRMEQLKTANTMIGGLLLGGRVVQR